MCMTEGQTWFGSLWECAHVCGENGVHVGVTQSLSVWRL